MNRATIFLEANKLIEKLTMEAINLFILGGNPEAPEASDLELTIALVAEAWELPQETVDKSRNTIAGEREVTRIRMRGEEAQMMVPQEKLLESDGGDDIMAVIWGLFEASVRLDTQEKREQILKSARFIADYLGLEEWITDTPCTAAKTPA